MTQRLVRALYPGTFDPFTRGHLHILTRASRIFGEVVIAAAANPGKGTAFTLAERLAFIEAEVQAAGLANVSTQSYASLTAEYARAQGCTVMIRGLRAISDYEFEVQMAIINTQIVPEVDTVFLMADKDFSFISSSIIKEILQHGGSVEQVSGMLSPGIASELKRRLVKAHAHS